MKTKKLTIVILLVVALLLLSVTAALALPKLAELTIQNKSDYTVQILIYEATELRHSAQNIEYPAVPNGEFHFLSVAPNTTSVFTLKRALFYYTLYVCGGSKTVSGPIDLTNGGRLVVPSICTTYYPSYEEKGTLGGIMEANTLVAFSVQNTTADSLYVNFSGPQVFSFWLDPFGTRSFTAEEGTYTYLYQCKGETKYFIETGSYQLRFHDTLKLGCD